MPSQTKKVTAFNQRRIAAIVGLAVVALVCVMLLWWLAVTGGGKFFLAGVRLFSLSSPWKPILVMVGAVSGILWTLDIGRFREKINRIRVVDWVFLILMVTVFLQAMEGDLELNGDAREYIIQTQAIVLQHRLSIDPDFIRNYWNETAPFGVKLGETAPPADVLTETSQAGGGFGGLYPDRFGVYRYYHFWAYSLVVAPLYALLHGFGGGLEYHAFRIMNVLFLLLPFVIAWRVGRGWPLLGVMVFILISPLIAYADWAHPELFCFALVIAAFQLAVFRRVRWWSPLLLGLAATQNLPILLFFPVHAYWLYRGDRQCRGVLLRGFIVYGAAGLLVFGSMLYFRYWFGVWNVIEAVGLASLSNSSWARVFSMLFSPLTGALWFFPAAFLFSTACLRRENLWLIMGMWLSILAAAWLAGSTANFNAGQIGAARYAVWLFAPLTFVALNGSWLVHRLTERWRGAAYLGAAILNVAIICYFGTYALVEKDIKPFGGAWRARPETARLLRVLPFHDDAETVIENIVGEEVRSPAHYNKVFIWDLGKGCSLWIIPERALRETRWIRWKTQELPLYASYPPNDLFVVEGEEAVLYPATVTNFARHPIIGRYIELRVKSNVPDEVRADCAVDIRY